MQEGLNQAYVSIAKALQANVVPVGTAWQRALREDPALELYSKTAAIPDRSGTYLAACAFYATLLDKNPVGLPAEVKKEGRTIADNRSDVGNTATRGRLEAVQDSKYAAPEKSP